MYCHAEIGGPPELFIFQHREFDGLNSTNPTFSYLSQGEMAI